MAGKWKRLLAALIAVMSIVGAPLSANAGVIEANRWAPSPDVEDGVLTPGADDAMPTSAAARANGVARSAVAIKAPSAILVEAKSGRVLFEKNAHEKRNPASVTKIMTLIVAYDALRDGKVKLEDPVTISEESAKQIGTIIFADEGETFTLKELLLSVAVGSANDAAVAVAEHVSGSVDAFVQAMNAKAKELGMNDTTFRNPTGLSAEGHLTSAYDIAMMGRYASVNYPELMKLTAIYEADLQVPWRRNGPTFKLWNNNKLLTWFRGADGFKTGWTEAAGYCLAATAMRDGVRMISVIMGADTWKLRNAEAAKLLEYGFSNYTSVDLAPKGKVMGTVKVSRGKLPVVDAIPLQPFGVSVAKGDKGKVKSEVKLAKRVDAPVKAGQELGEMIATMDGKEVGRMKLVAKNDVEKANLWETIKMSVGRVFRLE